MAALDAPWLHEEVGLRMEQRLQWIKHSPATWADWDPQRGGRKAGAAIRQRYAKATIHALNPAGWPPATVTPRATRWWQALNWRAQATERAPQPMPEAGVDLLWANMLLHQQADPQALMARWHQAIAVDGFLMFSCLGPDSMAALRQLYARLGWPAPAHELTDMHDWGDMLVQAGFAEPVMDMERISLSFSSPQALLQELRGLGRNLHVARFPALRARGWSERLRQEIEQSLPRDAESGRLTLVFEIIYGHAYKPRPRLKVAPETSLSMDEMRAALRQGRMSFPER